MMPVDVSFTLNQELVIQVIEILVAVLAGGSGVKIWQLFTAYIEQRQKARIPAVLDSIMDMLAVMHALRQKLGASRVILLRASNGGSRPAPGKPLYVTILQEVYDDRRPLRDEWEKRQVDEPYISMLSRLLAERYLVIETDRMAPGQLRTLYKADRAWGSIVIHLKHDDLQVFYLAVIFPQEPNPDRKVEREAAVQAAKARICNLLTTNELPWHL